MIQVYFFVAMYSNGIAIHMVYVYLLFKVLLIQLITKEIIHG
jgi:hypothetical protein